MVVRSALVFVVLTWACVFVAEFTIQPELRDLLVPPRLRDHLLSRSSSTNVAFQTGVSSPDRVSVLYERAYLTIVFGGWNTELQYAMVAIFTTRAVGSIRGESLIPRKSKFDIQKLNLKLNTFIAGCFDGWLFTRRRSLRVDRILELCENSVKASINT